MKKQLKACPFCGGDVVEYKRKGIKEPWKLSCAHISDAKYIMRDQIKDQLKGYKSNLVYRYAKKK